MPRINTPDSTVAAVSTAPGRAGIAVIRITGKDSLGIASEVFVARSGKALFEYPSAKAVFGDIFHNGEIIDNGICTVFRAPNSYTGEDTVEISCHGNDLVASMILSSLISKGARQAEPGEFTKRAFINGKLSLSQAEAVSELIDAESTAAIKLSNAHVSGKLSDEMEALAVSLTEILASVYAFIDYPDEDLTDMSQSEMRDSLFVIRDRLFQLKKSYDSGRAVSSGIKTVIAGLPNSGKSSLLNMLVGSDRAIVTDIPGTTRDVITEKVTLGNISLVLSDTAGIRETDDAVEKIGVERAYSGISDCELVLAVVDGASCVCDDEKNLLDFLADSGKKVVLVINKTDLGPVCPEKKEYLETISKRFFAVAEISAKNNIGKDKIENIISELYPAGDELLRSGLVITGARIYASVNGAYDAVCDALKTLEGYTPDLAGMDLERALAHLREADGRSISEDIVNSIFSKFCVGK